MSYTEVEAKVREATNDDAWGPTGAIMQEIAQYTFTYEHFPEVLGMLWKRMLLENKKNWRRVYKVNSATVKLLSLLYVILNKYKPQSRFARLSLDLLCTKARSRCAPAIEKGPSQRARPLRKRHWTRSGHRRPTRSCCFRTSTSIC